MTEYENCHWEGQSACSMDQYLDPKLKNCSELVRLFEWNQQNVIDNARELLDLLSSSGIDKLARTFNPLHILIKNYLPDEDDHSDLMAALLDPSERHGLSSLGLCVFLDIIAERDRTKEAECVAIRNEITNKGADGMRVFIRQRGDLSVPDIIITGEDFVIGIENKRSFGCENKTDHGWQTENQYRDLIKKNKGNTLYIYIHPEGMAPKCKYCVQMFKRDVTDWYEKVAELSVDKELGSFLKYYAQYYFKTI